MREVFTILLLSCVPLCFVFNSQNHLIRNSENFLFAEDTQKNEDWIKKYSKKKRLKNCRSVRLNKYLPTSTSKLKLIKALPIELKVYVQFCDEVFAKGILSLTLDEILSV